jgi:hypothetical protein
MKKLALIALVLVLTTAFVFAAFQAPNVSGVVFAGGTSSNVDKNSRACGVNAMAEPTQSVAFFIIPPLPRPNVGWNS